MPILDSDLDDALVGGLDVVLHGLSRGRCRAEAAPADQVGQRLERQVRVDRAGAVADQQAEVVDLARVAGFDDQAALRAQLLADQVMVQRRRVASSDGIGAYSASTPRSERIRIDAPSRRSPRVARVAELVQRLLQSRPPSAAWNSIGSVTDLSRTSPSSCFSFASSSLSRIGDFELDQVGSAPGRSPAGCLRGRGTCRRT